MRRPVLHALVVATLLSAVGLLVAVWLSGGVGSLRAVRALGPQQLVLAVLALLTSFVLSASRLVYICKLLGEPLKLRHALRAHVLGMFSAAVTPGGSGNVAGLALTLSAQGISQSRSWAAAVATMAADMTFHAWALPASLAVLYALGAYPRTPLWTAIGVGAFLLTTALAYALVFKVSLLSSFVSAVFRGPLTRFRCSALRFVGGVIESSEQLAAAPIRSHLFVQALTALAWLAFFSMLYFLLLGLGVTFGYWLVVAGQTVITVLSAFVPTPGASGFFEVALSWFFTDRGAGSAAPAAVLLWRLLSFYSLFVMGPLLGGYLLVRQVQSGGGVPQPSVDQEPAEPPGGRGGGDAT